MGLHSNDIVNDDISEMKMDMCHYLPIGLRCFLVYTAKTTMYLLSNMAAFC